MKKDTCITKTHKSTVDSILTNKPLPFQSGLSHHHKFIATFTKSRFTRLDLKTVCCKNKL